MCPRTWPGSLEDIRHWPVDDQAPAAARVADVPGLLAMQTQADAGSMAECDGERLWYALHGYAIESPARPCATCLAMPAYFRQTSAALEDARSMARLLLVKAARRMRRSSFYASTSLWPWLRPGQTWRHSAR
jgi:DNA polymerase-4